MKMYIRESQKQSFTNYQSLSNFFMYPLTMAHVSQTQISIEMKYFLKVIDHSIFHSIRFSIVIYFKSNVLLT